MRMSKGIHESAVVCSVDVFTKLGLFDAVANCKVKTKCCADTCNCFNQWLYRWVLIGSEQVDARHVMQ